MSFDLIFSDIHADAFSLNYILKIIHSDDFKKKYGELIRIFNLGDVLERGHHPKEVLTILKKIAKYDNLISVMGNHDEAFLYKRPVSGNSEKCIQSHRSLSLKDLDFFKKNDDGSYGSQEFYDKNNNMVCVHGGPLNPKDLINDTTKPEAWLYQKTWQRISETNSNYFSNSGYHYCPESAFREKSKDLESFIIICGHQHIETAFQQDNEGVIRNIFDDLPKKTDFISNHMLIKKDIVIETDFNYLIRVGIAGPEGYYGERARKPKFAIVQHEPKKITLFN